MSKQQTNNEPSMYSGQSHTALLSITGREDQGPADWHAIHFRAPSEDPNEALEHYLQETFGEDVEVQKDGDALIVDEPGFPAGDFRRYYRIP